MDKRQFVACAALVLGSAAGACTHRAWYEGFKSSAQHNCQHLSSPEYEDCIQHSEVGYDAYKHEREALDE